MISVRIDRKTRKKRVRLKEEHQKSEEVLASHASVRAKSKAGTENIIIGFVPDNVLMEL